MQFNGVFPRITAQQHDVPGVCSQQAEQHTDRRRLACTVWPQKTVDLPRLDDQVKPVESARLAEGLHEATHDNRRCHAATVPRDGWRI